MKYFYSFFFVWIGLFPLYVSGQQQDIFSQQVFNPVVLNSARVGLDTTLKVYFGHQSRYGGMNPAPRQYVLGGESSLYDDNLRSGMGVNLTRLTQGFVEYVMATGAYAYHIRSESASLSFGISSGIFHQRLNTQGLLIKDEEDPLLRGDILSSNFWVVGGGCNWSKKIKNSWLSIDISVPHAAATNLRTTDLPLIIGSRWKKHLGKWSIEPMVNVRINRGFNPKTTKDKRFNSTEYLNDLGITGVLHYPAAVVSLGSAYRFSLTPSLPAKGINYYDKIAGLNLFAACNFPKRGISVLTGWSNFRHRNGVIGSNFDLGLIYCFKKQEDYSLKKILLSNMELGQEVQKTKEELKSEMEMLKVRERKLGDSLLFVTRDVDALKKRESQINRLVEFDSLIRDAMSSVNYHSEIRYNKSKQPVLVIVLKSQASDKDSDRLFSSTAKSTLELTEKAREWLSRIAKEYEEYGENNAGLNLAITCYAQQTISNNVFNDSRQMAELSKERILYGLTETVRKEMENKITLTKPGENKSPLLGVDKRIVLQFYFAE